MSAKDIGEALVAHCKAGTESEALSTLYAVDCLSIEAMDPGHGRVAEGVDAIRGKHTWWAENFTVHSSNVEGPFPHGDDQFAIIFDVDAENKADGERSAMREIGVYTVKDGKIVQEAFYY